MRFFYFKERGKVKLIQKIKNSFYVSKIFKERRKILKNKIKFAFILIIISLIALTIYSSACHYTDLNSDPAKIVYEDLINLDGIGDILATRIIENRPYVSWDDLEKRVDGIGKVKIEKIKSKFILLQLREVIGSV
jgi:DNA polymerase III alpha subunit (gram-positive type)